MPQQARERRRPSEARDASSETALPRLGWEGVGQGSLEPRRRRRRVGRGCREGCATVGWEGHRLARGGCEVCGGGGAGQRVVGQDGYLSVEMTHGYEDGYGQETDTSDQRLRASVSSSSKQVRQQAGVMQESNE